MPDTDTLQWIALAVVGTYAVVLTVLTAKLAEVLARYAKDNRELWETHLGHKEKPLSVSGGWSAGPISDMASQVDPSLHGPRCDCDHVRLDHWGPCAFPGCGCRSYHRRTD